MANLALAGCAVSPADDRRPLTPTKPRDGGRVDDDDDDDEDEEDDTVRTRSGRDAGTDARVPSAAAPTDAGRAPSAANARDAGTRVDAASAAADAGAPAPVPAVPQAPPTAAEPNTGVPTSAAAPTPTDSGAGRLRGERGRGDEDDEDEEDDERPTARARDAGASRGASTPSRSGGTQPAAAPFICWAGRECQPTACKPNEVPCCRSADTTCGCTDRIGLGLGLGFLCR